MRLLLMLSALLSALAGLGGARAQAAPAAVCASADAVIVAGTTAAPPPSRPVQTLPDAAASCRALPLTAAPTRPYHPIYAGRRRE